MNFVTPFLIRWGDNSSDYPIDHAATLHRFRYDFDIDSVRCDDVFRAWLDLVVTHPVYTEADLERDMEWLEKLGVAHFYRPLIATMGMPDAPTFVALFGPAFVAHIVDNDPDDDAADVATLLRKPNGDAAADYAEMAAMVEYEDVGQFFDSIIEVLEANGYPSPL